MASCSSWNQRLTFISLYMALKCKVLTLCTSEPSYSGQLINCHVIMKLNMVLPLQYMYRKIVTYTFSERDLANFYNSLIESHKK